MKKRIARISTIANCYGCAGDFCEGYKTALVDTKVYFTSKSFSKEDLLNSL